MHTPLPPQELSAALGAFPQLRVLVLGDLFLDEYLEGEMFEISREGPIPVVKLASRVRTAGAAGSRRGPPPASSSSPQPAMAAAEESRGSSGIPGAP